MSDYARVRMNQRLGMRPFAWVDVGLRPDDTTKQEGRNCEQMLCRF